MKLIICYTIQEARCRILVLQYHLWMALFVWLAECNVSCVRRGLQGGFLEFSKQ